MATSVPNTNTFSLQDVVDVVGDNDLAAAFSLSNANYFDPLYGSKTMNPKTLYGFRNYHPNSMPPVLVASGGMVLYSNNNNTLPINYSNVLSIDSLFYNYTGDPWAYLVIESVNTSLDGDAYNFISVKYNNNPISSFPLTIDITGKTKSQLTGLSDNYNDPSGTTYFNIPIQSFSITFHVVDINGLSSNTVTYTYTYLFNSQSATMVSDIQRNSVILNGYSLGNAFASGGFFYGTTSPVGFNHTEVQVSSMHGDWGPYTLTGLQPNTKYYVRAFTRHSTGQYTIGGATLSFTTLP